MKFYNLQVNGWKWRTSYYVKLIRFRKPKAAGFLSYVTNIIKNQYKYKQYYEKQAMLRGGL
jgi:hypothetical protein